MRRDNPAWKLWSTGSPVADPAPATPMSLREIPYRKGLAATCASCPAARSALCGSLTDAHRKQLENIGHQVCLEHDDYLFLQHSDAQHIYNVISGVLMIERTTAGGRRQIIAFLFPGDFLGFSFNEFYEYSVRALTQTRLCAFKRNRFITICEDFPELKTQVGRIHNRILGRALDQIFALGQLRAHEKLCFLLWQLSERQGLSGDGRLNLVMSRQDIADYLGLTIETVSRAFGRLKQDGLIRLHRSNRIELIQTDEIAELAASI